MKVMYVLACTVVLCSNAVSSQSLVDSVKVLYAKDIPETELVPPDYLELNISFVEDPPYSGGFWFFEKERLLLKVKLTNKSDTTYYVPSVFHKNPSFSLVKEGKQIFGKNFDIIHPGITSDFFHRLGPKESYEKTVNIQEMYDFDFDKGEYVLTATFYCKYGKLIANSKEFPIWNGAIHSNSLKFSID